MAYIGHLETPAIVSADSLREFARAGWSKKLSEQQKRISCRLQKYQESWLTRNFD
ncbi:MAG TPA: hypothetical protein PLM56_03285 [Cyclobacteriaceae bacterium]|nr:hypothetical protein [Cytophagales bacterium]HNT50007.1 hypothetical protein [Cyclobacteriaceae bacterium]HRE67999.1 hypothetical protein [Cyclobacteriaceae bacterium]HRF32497.1 hypothetical protein [Cyclobacteriaceae bacterium]